MARVSTNPPGLGEAENKVPGTGEESD